jgi:hypothetical protein
MPTCACQRQSKQPHHAAALAATALHARCLTTLHASNTLLSLPASVSWNSPTTLLLWLPLRVLLPLYCLDISSRTAQTLRKFTCYCMRAAVPGLAPSVRKPVSSVHAHMPTCSIQRRSKQPHYAAVLAADQRAVAPRLPSQCAWKLSMNAYAHLCLPASAQTVQLRCCPGCP